MSSASVYARPACPDHFAPKVIRAGGSYVDHVDDLRSPFATTDPSCENRHVSSRRSQRRFARLADEDLIVAATSGDEAAFEVLYERHSRVAWSLAMRMLSDAESAEDVVQDAFLAVWRGSATYLPGKGSVRTWVLSVVHHRAVDRLRQGLAIRRRQEALETAALVTQNVTPDTSELALQRVAAGQVTSALDDVPPEQREVIRLAYFGGYSTEEIAQMLAVPLGTVKSRMRLGLERVRTNIGAGMAAT